MPVDGMVMPERVHCGRNPGACSASLRMSVDTGLPGPVPVEGRASAGVMGRTGTWNGPRTPRRLQCSATYTRVRQGRATPPGHPPAARGRSTRPRPGHRTVERLAYGTAGARVAGDITGKRHSDPAHNGCATLGGPAPVALCLKLRYVPGHEQRIRPPSACSTAPPPPPHPSAGWAVRGRALSVLCHSLPPAFTPSLSSDLVAATSFSGARQARCRALPGRSPTALCPELHSREPSEAPTPRSQVRERRDMTASKTRASRALRRLLFCIGHMWPGRLCTHATSAFWDWRPPNPRLHSLLSASSKALGTVVPLHLCCSLSWIMKRCGVRCMCVAAAHTRSGCLPGSVGVCTAFVWLDVPQRSPVGGGRRQSITGTRTPDGVHRTCSLQRRKCGRTGASGPESWTCL